MYKFFAFLFFVAASLLALSVLLWSTAGLPISTVIAVIVAGGVIYISFALSFIASRFFAIKKNILELPRLQKITNLSFVRLVCDAGLLFVTLVATLFISLSVGSWLVSHIVLPVFLSTVMQSTLTSVTETKAELTKINDRLSTAEFFSRNKYLYNLSDSLGGYKLEFASLEKEASSGSQVYHYNFEYRRLGGDSWDQTWNAIKLRDNETITDFTVSKIYYQTLSNPLLKVVVGETGNSSDSDGNGHTFLLYPSLKGANSDYIKLSASEITRGINIETATDTDGYPLVTFLYSGWRSGDREKYKLVLDTSEGVLEIIPQLIQT